MASKYLVRTFGCQMNEHDSERIAGLLESEGMEATTNVEDADVVVLNTCCIRENADNKLYGTLGHLKSIKDEHPEMQIAVAGCLAQKDREGVRERAPYVDVVFGTHNVANAASLLARAKLEGPITEIFEESEAFPSALPARRDLPYAAWVTIQIGCDNKCAFCIVPAVRGKEISRPFGEIISEVEALSSTGTVEVTLLGQNVNSYGRDIASRLRSGFEMGDSKSDRAKAIYEAGNKWATAPAAKLRPLFGDLIRAVGSVDGIRRVRFTSPHPKDLRPETIAAMAEVPEMCEHLHFPVQSGSNRVLAAMHRGYTVERYLEKVEAARAAVPDLAVTTDIIVGFPGETEDDFQRTLELAAEAQYDSVYTFIYSPRSGTEAALRVDQFVPDEVIAERFARLDVVVQRSALMKHSARIGKVEEVLVEGESRKRGDTTAGQTRMTGRTRQNKLVHFSAPTGMAAGSFAKVMVTEAGSHHLRGTLIGQTAPSRTRIRIPVLAG